MMPPPPKADNEQISKQLTWLLRHGAQKQGIAIGEDGFVAVADILRHSRFKALSLTKLQEIVANDKKQRYTLRVRPREQNTTYEIRANQGHSLSVVQAEACLERIVEPSRVPMAVHGTYYKNWERIKREGLKRLGRNQVHFAASDKLLTSVTAASGGCGSSGCKNTNTISGFRHDCQLLIYLNIVKVLADQIPLYRSSNNVILCAGVDGCIAPSYFERVVDRRTGKSIIA